MADTRPAHDPRVFALHGAANNAFVANYVAELLGRAYESTVAAQALVDGITARRGADDDVAYKLRVSMADVEPRTLRRAAEAAEDASEAAYDVQSAGVQELLDALASQERSDA